jgi:hypothetical protein
MGDRSIGRSLPSEDNPAKDGQISRPRAGLEPVPTVYGGPALIHVVRLVDDRQHSALWL